MGKRDPGSKPGPGDRIPFVYIQTKGKVKLQGDKVEHPDFVRENNLKLDYAFYITNQIMKPVQQVFALVLEDIQAFSRKRERFGDMIETLRHTIEDDEKFRKKIETLRNKEVKGLIFDDYLRQTANTSSGQKSISDFF